MLIGININDKNKIMSKATLIKQIDNGRIYRASTGKHYKLIMNDEQTEILINDLQNKQIGEFEFKELDYSGYKLMRMYSNDAKQSGLGRAALEYFRDVVGFPIYVSSNDGLTKNDGSHLTEDAPGFVAKMIEEQLIDGYENTFYNKDDINGFFE